MRIFPFSFVACLLFGLFAQATLRAASPEPGGTLTLTNRVVALEGKLSLSAVGKTLDQLVELDGVSHEPIYLKINAYGDSIETAYALFDTVQALESPVYAVVQSRAYQAGAIVALACDKVYIYPNAVMMFRAFQKVSVDAQSDDPPDDPFKNQYLDRLHTEVAKHLNVPLDAFKKKAEKGWWLDARQAVQAGAADAIVERLKYREVVVEQTEIKRSVTTVEKRQITPQKANEPTPSPKTP